MIDKARYGPCALIAGASEGIGACFAEELASAGFDLVLLARRPAPLEALATRLRAAYGVSVEAQAVDVGSEDFEATLGNILARHDIGLCVFNALASYVGPFLGQPATSQAAIAAVNVQAPMLVARLVGAHLVARGRGGLILMSSLAGLQGSPLVAAYGASKSFIRVLAEGLWAEWRPHGVDVLACLAGATDTPGFRASTPAGRVPVQRPQDVARQALAALGRKPVVITGWVNRLAGFVFQRLLPKSWAVRLMGRQTARLYGKNNPPR